MSCWSKFLNGIFDGRCQQFKSTTNFDGPYHLKQHGFAEGKVNGGLSCWLKLPDKGDGAVIRRLIGNEVKSVTPD